MGSRPQPSASACAAAAAAPPSAHARACASLQRLPLPCHRRCCCRCWCARRRAAGAAAVRGAAPHGPGPGQQHAGRRGRAGARALAALLQLARVAGRAQQQHRGARAWAGEGAGQGSGAAACTRAVGVAWRCGAPPQAHSGTRAHACAQGLVALAEALSMSPHLHTLLVWGNVFGPASSRAFSDTLAGLQVRGVHLPAAWRAALLAPGPQCEAALLEQLPQWALPTWKPPALLPCRVPGRSCASMSSRLKWTAARSWHSCRWIDGRRAQLQGDPVTVAGPHVTHRHHQNLKGNLKGMMQRRMMPHTRFRIPHSPCTATTTTTQGWSGSAQRTNSPVRGA